MADVQEKVAVVNANSFGRYFPEFWDVLEENVGPTERFTFPKDVTQKEVAEALRGFQYVICGVSPSFGEEFFEAAEGVKLVIRFGIGYNNVDVAAAEAHGVLCANVPSELERYDVAEQALTLLIALCKHLREADTAVRAGEWTVRRERFLGSRIHGKTVGVMGFGSIGSAFAEIMRGGFACRVIAYDPYVSREMMSVKGVEKVDLDTLLAESDFISLHIAVTPESYHILNAENVAKMKDGCIVVNSARGELVDEDAIADALLAGKMGGYGTDVIEGEPIGMDNRLLSCPNVVITPHLSVYNLDCNRTMNEAVVMDVIRVCRGDSPLHPLHAR